MRYISWIIFLCFFLIYNCFAEIATVTASSLNLRAAANGDAPVVASVSRNSKLEIVERNGSWCKVSLKGRTVKAWVAASLVSNGKLRSNANIRSGAGTNYPALGVLPAGTSVKVLQKSGKWCRISVVPNGGLYAYAASSYLKGSGQQGAAKVEKKASSSGQGPKIANVPSRASMLVYGVESGRIYYSRGGDKRVAIASLTKMMTLLVALEELERRTDIDLNTKVKISKWAASAAPTKAGLVPGKEIIMRELLQAMIIKSCNDCAAQVAEFFGGGNPDLFIHLMNTKARKLGMKNTKFFNPHGLPGASAAQDNYSTAEDLILLSRALMEKSLARQWVKTKSVRVTTGLHAPKVFNGHNHLLGKMGVDGIKTGYTQRAGCCIAIHASTSRGKYIIIVTGFNKSATRDAAAAELLRWALKQ